MINSYPCFLIDKIVPMRSRLLIAYTYILINIERVSKHSVTIRGLRVVTTCWSWAWSNRTSPSKWVGLGSPLAASSVYGDLTCSVHTVNNLCMFNCRCHFYLCNRGPHIRAKYVILLKLRYYYYYMSLVKRKPVFGISDQGRLKPACSVIETS